MNLTLPTDFSIYAQWAGILTLVCLGLTIIAAIARWGIRFRLVGITGFMTVLTIGLFGLSLGLSPRSFVEGSVRYQLIYDNGADQVVVAVPNTVNPTEVEATLRQVAADFYSPGRIGLNNQMTIRVRTIIHPETGLSKPVYLGEVNRSLRQRNDENMTIAVFNQEFKQLL
ncbi:MAG: hypothetical protein EA365_10820 [Gloeocapsa sp. DLM2.Bin57]|jgi:hypothetical protein|nr:MAG: hypothetical protein EA365_10820 [Gloeocapsa sp. DLM2.Bin57]